jgi:hypothetical protein
VLPHTDDLHSASGMGGLCCTSIRPGDHRGCGIGDMPPPARAARIVTLCVRGRPAKAPSQNHKRVKLLRRALRLLVEHRDWLPIDAVVLPAAYFRIEPFVGDLSHSERLRLLAQEPAINAAIACCSTLWNVAPGACVIVGLDSLPPSKKRKGDQLCAVLQDGELIALTRKIFPTIDDVAEGYVPAVIDYADRDRIITLANGSRAILCVCYDMFGVKEDPDRPSIRSRAIKSLFYHGRVVRRRDRDFAAVRHAQVDAWHQLLRRQQPDIAIAVVHRFERPGLDGYWQRHGIATASAALGGFAVGAAHFRQWLPHRLETPLAASGVPADHLAQGPHRRAWPHLPVEQIEVYRRHRPAAVLRLYTDGDADSWGNPAS